MDIRNEQLKMNIGSIFECLNLLYLIYLMHHDKFFVTLDIVSLAFDKRIKSLWAVSYQMETEHDVIIKKQQQDK